MDEIVVVDDFWADPDAVRAEALSARFVKRSIRGYSYHEARPPQLTSLRGRNRILHLIGNQFKSSYLESRFVLETYKDQQATQANRWVHFDRCRWVAICYLSLPYHCKGGTAFYQHKPSECKSWGEMLSSCRSSGESPSFNGINADEWLEISRVDMKFNRMVLFDSRLFHQAVEYFGTVTEDSRLYQHFAFSQMSDDDILREFDECMKQ